MSGWDRAALSVARASAGESSSTLPLADDNHCKPLLKGNAWWWPWPAPKKNMRVQPGPSCSAVAAIISLVFLRAEKWSNGQRRAWARIALTYLLPRPSASIYISLFAVYRFDYLTPLSLLSYFWEEGLKPVIRSKVDRAHALCWRI